MKRRVHAAAAVLALLFLSIFWVSTIAAELFLSQWAVVWVKHGIAYALLVFVPILMTVAGTGFSMGGKGRNPLLVEKRKRMPIVVANGVLVLAPSAIFLSLRSSELVFDGWFYSVQAIELAAGALNIALIGLNARDGFRLSQRRSTALAALQKAHGV